MESERTQSYQLLAAAEPQFYGTTAPRNLMTWNGKSELSQLASNPVLFESISAAGECPSIEMVGSSNLSGRAN